MKKSLFIGSLYCLLLVYSICADDVVFYKDSLEAGCSSVKNIAIYNQTECVQIVELSVEKENAGKSLSNVIRLNPKQKAIMSSDGAQLRRLDVSIINPDGSSFVQCLDEKSRIIMPSYNDRMAIFLIRETFGLSVCGKMLRFVGTHPNDGAVEGVKKEISEGEYYFGDFSCVNGDVMIDIGAHVGIISILYAKLFPELTVYAFEPVPENYEALLKNLNLNNVSNVVPINKAVTGNGRDVKVISAPWLSASGTLENITGSVKRHWPEGASSVLSHCVASISLDQIFRTFNIKKCKFLKIDCEGSEYEILLNAPPLVLKNTEYLAGEFHIDDNLKGRGYSTQGLVDYCKSLNPALKMKITQVRTKL
ncbi:FkbM family methyltransferase [bacterium]|jgi:FkbM family methyltransferase|nr:FkbM family methyltransferase [bacterium]